MLLLPLFAKANHDRAIVLTVSKTVNARVLKEDVGLSMVVGDDGNGG